MDRAKQIAGQVTAAPVAGTAADAIYVDPRNAHAYVNPATRFDPVPERYSQQEWGLRCQLAVAYRIAAHYDWDQLVFNHITVKVPESEKLEHGPHFLINPFGLHFREVTASSLLKVGIDGKIIDEGTGAGPLFMQGFVVHSAVHAHREDLHCVWHCHHPDTAAISMQKCGLLMLSQESLAFAGGRLSYHPFEGTAVDLGERDRIAKSLGPVNKAVLLENHGPVTGGATVEEAFVLMYLLTRACTYQQRAMAAAGGDLSKLITHTEEKVIAMSQREVTARTDDAPEEVKPDYDTPHLMFRAAVRLIEEGTGQTGSIAEMAAWGNLCA
eukprot:CAMPEP_0204371472 /NCGR_PEP_ID=MMETSP0469-20131031/46528_1 /ASSEMBLY_ACC=CAM_ASM_000384 /TAXON_ID=2969 /ORGANISM="Oxyrrhis marina" /LENGTH=325 /DNA_ID=CAMNT_0051361591 /DNA_START=40 /DNA_END=1018 /DNA_ORIENTATION=+